MSAYTVIALLLFLLAIGLIAIARRQRSSLGLPDGAILYQDMDPNTATPEAIFDPELNLVGRPDYLMRNGEEYFPVEVKTGNSPRQPYESHIYQLAAYCLLVSRSYGHRPSYGLIRYPKRTFKIHFTSEVEERTLQLIQEIHTARSENELSRSHQHSARCKACGFLQICDQKLVGQL